MEGKRKKKNNAKFSSHYVHKRTHNVCAHTLHSDQFEVNVFVLNIQKQHNVHDDFTQQILEDNNYPGIELLEQNIKVMKKELFKKYVKVLESKENEFFMNMKENHSKTKDLISFSLQPYFISDKFTTKEKQLLFSLEVKINYKNKYKFNMLCSSCEDNREESEQHLLLCKSINDQLRN